MKTLILPPGMNIMLIIVGLLIIKRYYATGKTFIILGFSLLLVLSLPITAEKLNLILEQENVLTLNQLKKSKAKAIVVLGAGRYKNSIEYEGKLDSISSHALARLSYAAYLHRKSQIPLLLSGGSPHGRILSEAFIMQTALEDSFNLKAKWLDGNSSNTWNNAKFSAHLLAAENIKDIIIVTHADHMPRARLSFEHFGFAVTVAPLGFTAKNKTAYTLLDFLPSANAMARSSSAMHELIGYMWYLIRHKGLSL